MELTAAHWVYLAGIIVVLATMAFRRETPLVCVVLAFVLSLVITGSFVGAVQAVFTSIQVAFSELLGIVLIISLIVAMAKMLEETGIAEIIFRPIQRSLRSAGMAFWVMGLAVMISAWLLWPSPAIALVGALLLPAAIAAGLPPIGAAMAISMFGYGIALTTDFVIQGAPSIAAKAAGVDVTDVMWASVPLVIVWAIIALPLAYLSVRKDIKANGHKPFEWEPLMVTSEEKAEVEKWSNAAPTFKKFAIPLIGILFALDIWAMLAFKIRGGDATALLGGTVALIMVILALGVYRSEGLEKLTDHGRSGFIFGVRIFTPVFFIASFFFMGSPGTASAIFGEGANGLLFDLGQALGNAVPLSAIPVALVQAAAGTVTGLDGSGFSGLPLVGSMAQALGGPTDLNMPALTALGQFFCVVIGGGTVIPWALIPAAAITGTDPVEVARRNLIPTALGCVGVIVVSIFLL